MNILVTGGARSGKSSCAARLAQEIAEDICLIVTALPSDDEMRARIAVHRATRPQHWHVREAPLGLGAAVREESARYGLVLIDCLTLWTANCLWPQVPDVQAGPLQPDYARWQAERAAFLEALRDAACPIVMVTNEVGSGIVPDSPAARVFRDEHGWLNQKVASLCEQVIWVVSGIPVRIK